MRKQAELEKKKTMPQAQVIFGDPFKHFIPVFYYIFFNLRMTQSVLDNLPSLCLLPVTWRGCLALHSSCKCTDCDATSYLISAYLSCFFFFF